MEKHVVCMTERGDLTGNEVLFQEGKRENLSFKNCLKPLGFENSLIGKENRDLCKKLKNREALFREEKRI